MKGDEVVELRNEVSDDSLFLEFRERNSRCFHSGSIDTTAVANSIHMRLKSSIDKLIRSEIQIIEIGVCVLTMKCVICGTNKASFCSHFKTSLERTQVEDEVAFLHYFIIGQTSFIVLQFSIRFVTKDRASSLNNSQSGELSIAFV